MMSDQCVGEIRMFAGSYEPSGWFFCAGQSLAIANFEVLFSLIGTSYGGDGVTTFKLPDLRGRIPLSQGKSLTNSAYLLAQQGGTETVKLLEQNIPSHTHPVIATTNSATAAAPANDIFAAVVNASGGELSDVGYLPNADSVSASLQMNTSAVTTAGQSLAHANIMPSSPVNFIIAHDGVYPMFS